jgi:AcrR family transcriptional regulator
MGRPREHDEHTAAALLRAAERTIEGHGPDALSVRGLAAEVGTSTRAVYSLFGSKEGLIAALGAHAFDLLRNGLDALATTDDPGADLIAAGLMFRRFATEHPSLFAIGVQRSFSTLTLWKEQVQPAAERALTTLNSRVARLADAGLLRERTVAEATLEFHALCEGLAALELRDPKPAGDWERRWASAFATQVAGFAAQANATAEANPAPHRRA